MLENIFLSPLQPIMPHGFGGFEPRSGPFSSGRTQYRGQNFVHLSGEISLFPKEIFSNTAAGPPAEGLAEASASPQVSFDLGCDLECRC